MNRTLAKMMGVFIICCMVIAAAGCGGGSKRRISFHKKRPRHSRSRYVVRGQSHKKPPATHKGMFIWPLDKFVFMSGFGIRRGRRHDGVDLSAKGGTPIKAAADGVVAFSGRMRGYGNLILLKHNKNYFSAYAHNRANLVKKGKKVGQGQLIARVGRTGRSTGNHVHFEIRQGQQAMDPLSFLPARAGVLVKKSSSTKKATVASTSKKRKRRKGTVRARSRSRRKSSSTTVAKAKTKSKVKRSKGAKIREGVAKLQAKKAPTTTPAKTSQGKTTRTKTTVAKKSKISSKDPAVKKPAVKRASNKKLAKKRVVRKLALKKTKSGKAMSNK